MRRTGNKVEDANREQGWEGGVEMAGGHFRFSQLAAEGQDGGCQVMGVCCQTWLSHHGGDNEALK